MNLEMLKQAGTRFDFCRHAVVPEIPDVQDVLYALRLSDEEKNYSFCRDNHATYIVNVGLVIAAVGYKVLCMERYDKAEARKIIAQAIIELCPAEAKCLFQHAFVEAKELATGQEVLPSETMEREALLQACGCQSCREIILERNLDEDPYYPV